MIPNSGHDEIFSLLAPLVGAIGRLTAKVFMVGFDARQHMGCFLVEDLDGDQAGRRTANGIHYF